MTDDVITLGVTWEDILWQMLSCCGLVGLETFTRQPLSSNKPKEVWRIIHRILKPNQQPFRQDPDKLKSFFACTAERTLPVSSDLPFCLEELIESLPVMIAPLISSSVKCPTVRSCAC